MVIFMKSRWYHYLLICFCFSFCTFPNLGKPSLWDMDEGVNAEAAREMLERGDWIVPTFNFQLRTAKPALLYWLQMTSYRLFGINEWAARFPSALMSLGTIILVYELGRKIFSPKVGLYSSLILSSSILFCCLSHFANPDATLLFFTTLTYYFFWFWHLSTSGWLRFATGSAIGFAVLTKGPVGLVIPAWVMILTGIFNQQSRTIWNRKLIWTWLGFLLTALPWYILVSTETRGAWLKAFIGKENIQRFSSPMENHRGPFFYHLLGLFIFFAPWSIFLIMSCWNASKQAKFRFFNLFGHRSIEDDQLKSIQLNEQKYTQKSFRFLSIWILSYLAIFSIAATKLPNYIFPIYPALAILVAKFIITWQENEIHLPNWLQKGFWFSYGLVGIIFMIGLLVLSGTIPIPGKSFLPIPGLFTWSFLGLIPILTSIVLYTLNSKIQRKVLVNIFVASSILFTGSIAAFPPAEMSQFRAPRSLIANAEVCQPEKEIQIGSLLYFQESLVFYGQREVKKFDDLQKTIDFLKMPYPVFVFVEAPIWEKHSHLVDAFYSEAARHYDFMRRCDILVLSNRK